MCTLPRTLIMDQAIRCYPCYSRARRSDFLLDFEFALLRQLYKISTLRGGVDTALHPWWLPSIDKPVAQYFGDIFSNRDAGAMTGWLKSTFKVLTTIIVDAHAFFTFKSHDPENHVH